MAEVQDHDICSSGIKLFGTTISLKERSSEVNSINHDDDEEEHKRSDLMEKRPDKIIPCPRCKSMETKFCYFNNYNVNQPRHFCKGCQRYWTAGGALRNVPVGAGRRKTKPPCRGLSAEALTADGCFYEAVSVSGRVQQLDFVDGVVEEWREAAEHGGFRHLKRTRCGSNSQSC